ncbi:MAG: hypothetical protein II672_07655, partial [Oscillospiraceae bacterium]|nr:hypothetical protein [Oscillospiraceae bacterium]
MNNRQNLNENGNYGYTYAQQPYYTERPERRGGSALSVIAVILAVALMFGYMQMNRDSSRNTAPQVIYQTVPYENRTQTAPAAQTPQNSASENTATQNESARPTKGTDKTDATLVDLKTIPELIEFQQKWTAALLASPFRPDFSREYGDLMFVNAEIELKTFSPEIIPELQ